MTTLRSSDAQALARAWVDIDPDPETCAEIDELFSHPDELERRFGDRLTFGTAGVRGRIGAGPLRMNRVLVRVVAAALATRLAQDAGDHHVVVGFDARHKSRDFAHDTARVFAARGIRVTLLPDPLPTPVLAFSVAHLGASAGVMVTASHNPRDDNGYKVYWAGGAQITAPVDRQISALIDAQPLVAEADLVALDDPGITVAGHDLLDAYAKGIVALLDPDGPRTTRIAYTPLHGVGAATLQAAFARAGFPPPAIVEAQAAPDPDFPTAPFPNPEEAGATDLLLALAADVGADVAMANDPDADRLAVAIPNGPSWRLLTGDEVGGLLAEHELARSGDGDRLVVNTVVSSRMLGAIAAHHGARYVETLTGFKWIMHARSEYPAAAFVLGYEEALGYAVGDVVHDKDGISAALAFAELTAWLAAEGRTPLDLLDDLHRRHGVHVTGQRSVRFEDTGAATPPMTDAMDALRRTPPVTLGDAAVTSVADLAEGGDLPPTNALTFTTPTGRIVVRPSGTEPKMKVYGEVIAPAGDDLAAARASARRDLVALLDAAVTAVTSPEEPNAVADPADDVTIAGEAAALFAQVPSGVARAGDLRLVVRCIDLTTLEGDDTPGRVRALCAQARRPDPADPTVGPVAAVCVYPSLVPVAAALTGTAVKVASVAGAFPSGLSAIHVRLADITDAITSGADEIDIVLNRSAFLSGDDDRVLAEIRASKQAAGSAHLKVILEVGELGSSATIAHATRLAIEGGADVVKTSTGKTKVNASPGAVLVMAREVAAHAERTGAQVGVKVAGGVRTADDALGYLAIIRAVLGDEWLTARLFRFGASSLLAAVLADLSSTEAALR